MKTGLIGKISQTILDLLFPPVCIICGRASSNDICSDCLKQVIREERTGSRNEGLYNYGSLWCYARYTGAIRETVARCKFRGEMWIGKCIGRILAEAFGDRIGTFDFIVYVPVSIDRRKQRGFDQCAEIASEFSKMTGIPLLDVMENISGDRRQSKLKRDLRKDSPRGRFVLRNTKNRADIEKIAGSKLLLIDDILTTGATLRECAGLLIGEGGAASVDAMVFASGRTDVH